MDQKLDSTPKMSDLLRLIQLMGREAHAAWSERIHAERGRPPTQWEVEDLFSLHTLYGTETFRAMVQQEYGYGGGIMGETRDPVEYKAAVGEVSQCESNSLHP